MKPLINLTEAAEAALFPPEITNLPAGMVPVVMWALGLKAFAPDGTLTRDFGPRYIIAWDERSKLDNSFILVKTSLGEAGFRLRPGSEGADRLTFDFVDNVMVEVR